MKKLISRTSQVSLTLAILSAGALFFVGSCASSAKPEQSQADTTSVEQPEAVKKKPSYVQIHTPYGDMRVLLYDDTPLHRDNFLKLVEQSYYDSLLFHRVIQGFMIQGGDPASRGAAPAVPLGQGGPGYTVPAEFSKSHIHKKGALAAARMGDSVNPKKESSGSQFYIVQGKPVPAQELVYLSSRLHPGDSAFYSDEQIQTYATLGGTPHLDGSYTVFGEVVEGLEVIDTIAAQPTDQRNRPLENITMHIEKVN